MAPWRVQRGVNVGAIPRSNDLTQSSQLHAGGFTERQERAAASQALGMMDGVWSHSQTMLTFLTDGR